MADTLTPERAAERLCELSADVREAVLLDAAGSLVASADGNGARARRLAELARRLFEEVDRATRDWETEPPQQVEVQVPGGAVFASRTPRFTLAAVARRGALASLMLYDLRAVLDWVEGGPAIRRALPAEERAEGPASEEERAAEEHAAEERAAEEHAAEELPMPELGGEPA